MAIARVSPGILESREATIVGQASINFVPLRVILEIRERGRDVVRVWSHGQQQTAVDVCPWSLPIV